MNIVLRDPGLSLKWSHNFVLGFTDTETVMLDFDNVDLDKVKDWARKSMSFFKLGGFIILRSSKNSFHVIFDRTVSWSENLSIVGRIVLMTHHRLLQRWHLMQCIKQSMTIRVSPKGDKSGPWIVFREGRQNEQIVGFLSYRKLIIDIMLQLDSKVMAN